MDENGLLEKPQTFKAESKECDNREFSFAYPLATYGVAYLHIKYKNAIV